MSWQQGGQPSTATWVRLLPAFLAEELTYTSSGNFYDTCTLCGPGDQNNRPPTTILSCLCGNGEGLNYITSIDLSECGAIML